VSQPIVWPDKDPAEKFTITFTYAKELDVSETIVLATIAVVLRDGTDAASGGLLDGAYQVDGPQVLQKVKEGIAGCNYGLRADALTSAGRVLTRAGILPVRLIV